MLEDEPVYCLGVSKSWCNRSAKKHPRAKQYNFGYFVTESGKFYSRRVSLLEAIALKRKIHRYKRMVCIHCGSKFDTLQPRDHFTGKRVCPVCNR